MHTNLLVFPPFFRYLLCEFFVYAGIWQSHKLEKFTFEAPFCKVYLIHIQSSQRIRKYCINIYNFKMQKNYPRLQFLHENIVRNQQEISQEKSLNRRLQIQHFTQPDLRSTVKLRCTDQQIQFRIRDCKIPNPDLCPRLVTLVMKRSLGIWKTDFKPK